MIIVRNERRERNKQNEKKKKKKEKKTETDRETKTETERLMREPLPQHKRETQRSTTHVTLRYITLQNTE